MGFNVNIKGTIKLEIDKMELIFRELIRFGQRKKF